MPSSEVRSFRQLCELHLVLNVNMYFCGPDSVSFVMLPIPLLFWTSQMFEEFILPMFLNE